MTAPTMKYVQVFLLVLIFGFLAGPRVIEALQRLQPDGDMSVSANAGAKNTSLAQAQKLKEGIIENPYGKLVLHAKSAYVWDVHTRRKLYSVNGETQLPLASVTKMMTALVAAESLPPETRVAITLADISKEGDTGLYAGEVWVLEKLLQFTLIASSNDGASAIAATVGRSLAQGTSTDLTVDKKLFVEKMNDKARLIGLTQTSFQNETGLDVGGGRSGGIGSARDMAMLFEYIFRKHPVIFTPTSYTSIDLQSESNFLHHVVNTNQDVGHITGLIGSKTGYTDLAGGNLVVVVDIGVNHPVIIAVLGSTREGRFTDVQQLIAAALADITHSETQ